jgi:aquaporin Z
MRSMLGALKRHWPEYGIEAALLGAFMIAACTIGVLLDHPQSPLSHWIAPFPRRLLTGMAMGATAIAIIYSPWGKRSGAHINPAVTLTFFRLGKIDPWDAAFYVVAQFTGAVLGVLLSAALLGALVADPSVNYAATVPGAWGLRVAFSAEILIAFLMMSMILRVTNQARLARYTGLFAGALVCTFITFEAPLSGMSMNPARTFGSAFPLGMWTTLWLYFLAPLVGMTLASEVYRRQKGLAPVICAKLHHDNDQRCIFRCGYAKQRS